MIFLLCNILLFELYKQNSKYVHLICFLFVFHEHKNETKGYFVDFLIGNKNFFNKKMSTE